MRGHRRGPGPGARVLVPHGGHPGGMAALDEGAHVLHARHAAAHAELVLQHEAVLRAQGQAGPQAPGGGRGERGRGPTGKLSKIQFSHCHPNCPSVATIGVCLFFDPLGEGQGSKPPTRKARFIYK